ncbi:Small subunit (SSU) processome component [Coelomomyces lativittatus]|nr:Small subunit (SSU) processome component [Coelomomyces lativittatus]KAJ1511406.1 Small subunit (SSU) processome component [Coelomomyces lativittatus]KAJ1515510.1 Small subunit (SSU) processome component [Coelomomyces lativittatus]
MVRKLKYHEGKLLKKVDFFQWKTDFQHREVQVIRRYHIQKREDYTKYNRLCGQIRQLAHRISLLDPKDPFKKHKTQVLLDKLVLMGLINTSTALSQCEKITVSSFCRRRLPILMLRMKMAETTKQAITFVEQGHVRVGPHVVTDPAFLVTKSMEDFITWVDTSKIKRKVLEYNDQLDDYSIL